MAEYSITRARRGLVSSTLSSESTDDLPVTAPRRRHTPEEPSRTPDEDLLS